MIIVFEGIDGSGKDTQIELLLGYLKECGKSVARFKFPSERARLALAHLQGKASAAPATLFSDFASDIESQTGEVLSAAKSHDVVVIDRYIFSTIAYQGAQLGVEKAVKLASEFKLARPDVVVFLEISPELAYARKKAQKEQDRFESDLDFQKQVAANYRVLLGMSYGAGRWAALDSSKSPSEVHRKIIKEVVQE